MIQPVRACSVFVIAAALLVVLPSGAQSPQEVAQRAFALSNLRAEGSPPFRMTGSVRLFEDEALAGRFEIFWASPEHWRTLVILDGREGERFGGGNLEWRAEKEDPKIGRTFHTLRHLKLPYVGGELNYRRLRTRTIGGRSMQCTESRSAAGRFTLCVDPESGRLAQLQTSTQVTEFSDFRPVGDRMFPHLVQTRSGGKMLWEVALETVHLEPVEVKDRPRNENMVALCAAHTLHPRLLQTRDPEHGGSRGTVVLSLVVNVHGVPENVRVTRSLTSYADAVSIEAVRQWRFQPATCEDGTVVPGEINVEVNFR